MRIVDELSDQPLRYVQLLLTPSEAHDLHGALGEVLERLGTTYGDHVHVSDLEMSRRITLSIYTSENLDQFDPKYRRLIVED